jgi:hypothetical protein
MIRPITTRSELRSLVILAGTATLLSRTVLMALADPEGPNLIVVLGLAGVIYLPSLLPYQLRSVRTIPGRRRLLFASIIQMSFAASLWLLLR